MTREEAREIIRTHGLGYSTSEFIQALRVIEEDNELNTSKPEGKGLALKVPDKIYVKPTAFETPWPPYIDENANYGGEEYIRKDMLIEWAKGEQSKCSDETHPYYQFMNVVLEKINSL